MDEKIEPNGPRRMDIKQVGIGGAIGAAIIALTPLNSYISDRQKPLEIKVDSLKELTDLKLETLQKTADRIEGAQRNQVAETQELKLKVSNLEFIAKVKAK
jgi:hypothetical protein